MVNEQPKQASLFDIPKENPPTRVSSPRAVAGEGGNKKIAQRYKPANPGKIIASGTKNHINLKTGQFLCYDCGRDSGIGTVIKGYVYCRKCARGHQDGQ